MALPPADSLNLVGPVWPLFMPDFSLLDWYNWNRGTAFSAKYLRGINSPMFQRNLASLGAKHYLRHGQFIHWVDQQAGTQPRNAQAYMRVAQWVANKNAKVAHLPPTMLYILSARSTPSDYVINIMKMIDAGQDLPSLLMMRRELKSLCGGQSPEDDEVDIVPTDVDGSQYKTTEVLVREAVELAAQNMSNIDFERFCTSPTKNAGTTRANQRPI